MAQQFETIASNGFLYCSFEMATMNHDISILELDRKVKLSKTVNPICMTPADLTFFKEMVTVMGWGKTGPKKKDTSPNIIQEVNVTG